MRVVQALLSKRSSNEIQNGYILTRYVALSKCISAALGLALIFIEGKGFQASPLTVIIATFSGITLFFSSFFSTYAMKSGTISLNSMFSTAGMLVPLIAGVFLFDQPIRPMQWAGVGVFMISAWLLIGSSRDIFNGFSIKTLFLLLGSMLANGGTMLAQQMFTAYVPDGNVTVFSFLSFGIIAILTFVTSFFMGKQREAAGKTKDKLSRALIICAFFLASAVFVINQLATLSTALVSPVILFTFINGGGTVISTIVAAIVYNERLTKKSVVGVILGIVSLVIVKMF